jgi:hypothetical protein
MPRTPRTQAHALRSLLLGAAVIPATLLGVGTLSGCRDENDPATWAAELSDPTKQTSAVKRLKQFYEDALTRSCSGKTDKPSEACAATKKDRQAPNVKAVLDKIVEPMTKVCLETGLTPKSRSELIGVLADAQDERADACLKKTIEDYKAESPSKENEADVQQIVRGVLASKRKTLGPSILKLFTSLKTSKAKTAGLYQEVLNAMLLVADKANEDTFVELLGRPILDPTDAMATQDEIYWQTGAARALGNLRSEKAVTPLLKLLLTPAKAGVHSSALIALVKIGQPAVAPTEALLKGDAKDLIQHSTDEQIKVAEKDKDGKVSAANLKKAEKAYIEMAAQVLGNLGSESSVKPLLSALEKADDLTKVFIAMQLPLLPKTPETIAAFQKVFEEAKADLEFPNGGRVRPALYEAASGFGDAGLVPWIVKTASEAKGEQADLDQLRSPALLTVMKLAKPDQLGELDKLAGLKAQDAEDENKKKIENTVGKSFEKELKAVKELLGECKDGVDCYLAKLTDGAVQEKAQQIKGIKAAYMIAMFGDDATRAKLVELIPKIDNDAIRYTAQNALQILAPKGDGDAADKLLARLEKAEEQKDQESIQNYSLFRQTAARLRARMP